VRTTHLLNSNTPEAIRKAATSLVTGLALTLAIGLFSGTAFANASKWVAPQDERDEKNPIERDEESVATGRELYTDNCLTCHGPTGYKGPGTEIMGVLIPNLTDAAWIATETDGSLFYKIAVGKDPMMAYEEYLDEDEIWHIVNFVRTLTVGGAQEPEEVEVAAAEPEHAEHAVHEDDARPEEAGRHETADDGHQAEATSDHGTAHGGEHGDAGHGGGHSDAHQAPYTGPAFETDTIRNYEPSSKKAPLAIALFASIAIGGIISTIAKSD